MSEHPEQRSGIRRWRIRRAYRKLERLNQQLVLEAHYPMQRMVTEGHIAMTLERIRRMERCS